MIAYVGDTRSKKLLERLKERNIGQIIIRGKLNGRRLDKWAYDNGAFVDWKKGRPFDFFQWEQDLNRIDAEKLTPDFCVLPDIVTGGLESLRLSLKWLERRKRHDWYLAVQDGMTIKDIPWSVGVAGIFIGGSLEWKLATGRDWVSAAHNANLKCHIGRVGTRRRVAWAQAIKADSIDSCLPMWSRKQEEQFNQALNQLQLFFEN